MIIRKDIFSLQFIFCHSTFTSTNKTLEGQWRPFELQIPDGSNTSRPQLMTSLIFLWREGGSHSCLAVLRHLFQSNFIHCPIMGAQLRQHLYIYFLRNLSALVWLDVLDKLHCVLVSAGNTAAPVFAPTKSRLYEQQSNSISNRTENCRPDAERPSLVMFVVPHSLIWSFRKKKQLFIQPYEIMTEITFRVYISVIYSSQLTSSHYLLLLFLWPVPWRDGYSQSSASIYLCVTPTITTTLCHLSLHPYISSPVILTLATWGGPP